ncbi:MAG: cytochrome b5-like heme/steroid binding domain-containing protein [Nanoarchaeota archaeon]|nr:cytochrome b5-like heme/steroid binding domain-containing protein [Nanoarchaeota archaeon]
MNKKLILALLIALFIVGASFAFLMKKDSGEEVKIDYEGNYNYDNFENVNISQDRQNSTGNSTNITFFELKTHNSKEDCWVSYKKKVYDVTSFLPKHPGSAAAIIPYCGTAEEFEKAFTGQHGTSQVKTLERMGIYKGELE